MLYSCVCFLVFFVKNGFVEVYLGRRVRVGEGRNRRSVFRKSFFRLF